jgi:hypothetical protein
MDKFGNVKFSGTSGNQYKFAAYPLETVFDEAFSGVYVVTRRRQRKSKSGFVHKRICTGQCEDLCQPLADSKQHFSGQGANCLCVHAEKDKDARRKIEQDLFRVPRPESS